MKLALRELRRRPGRFAVATVVLTFITVLLMFLGGLLDGLFLGSTGAIRAQRADVFVYSAASRESFLRSRITPEIRAQVEQAPGVEQTGGLGFVLVGAKVPGDGELADAAVAGYELAPEGVPDPPAPGKAYADRRLADAGVEPGQTLLLGPAEVPVEVVGWVEDTSYLLQGTLWVEPGTWRQVQDASRPDSAVGDGVFQVLVVNGSGDASDLAASIDGATNGATTSLTKAQAINSLPGTTEQRTTFNQIIFTTLAIAVIVVALFFALLTLERTGLYGVLKAIGASSGQLFAGVLLQALAVALIAFAIGVAIVYVLAALLPAALPLQIEPGRLAFTLVGLVVAAVIGGFVSLRRVVKIDPASAIGS